ncbi:MAG TPA: DUF3883 domain-containing protein [Candidatus Acidoferrum sp.]|nr:DUF3883 domain-containing protein [Candidatus Acidoferrum sp.]
MKGRVEDRAMKFAECYYRKKGWEVKNVARARGEHFGYDLFLERGSERLKVEVKGSAKPYHGIPDLYKNEVDEHKRLRADFLCVVYFPLGKPEKLAIIPRDRILPDCLKPKISYCISSKFKGPESIREFLVDTEETCSPQKRRAIES